jgi:hypothetical protein
MYVYILDVYIYIYINEESIEGSLESVMKGEIYVYMYIYICIYFR